MFKSEPELEKTRESAINLANELNAEYWEVSAKTGNDKSLITRLITQFILFLIGFSDKAQNCKIFHVLIS